MNIIHKVLSNQKHLWIRWPVLILNDIFELLGIRDFSFLASVTNHHLGIERIPSTIGSKMMGPFIFPQDLVFSNRWHYQSRQAVLNDHFKCYRIQALFLFPLSWSQNQRAYRGIFWSALYTQNVVTCLQSTYYVVVYPSIPQCSKYSSPPSAAYMHTCFT